MAHRDLTSEQRLAAAHFSINPGYINERRLLTVLGAAGQAELYRRLSVLPQGMHPVQQRWATHRIQVDALIEAAQARPLPLLEELLLGDRGELFCSIERMTSIPTDRELRRVTAKWIPRGISAIDVTVRFSVDQVFADTLREWLASSKPVAIIGQITKDADGVACWPIVIGEPWLDALDGGKDLSWHRDTWFEIFPEDIDQFAKVRSHPLPASCDPMRSVSEVAFKQALVSLLGDTPSHDWGGEQHDYFSAHLTIKGERTPAAFLLKGPGAGFKPMTLDFLGKRNNQIVRLSDSAAQLLVVQHCHEISDDVRKTLRAFAVRPYAPRRYCLIDGRDSLRLLSAYGLLGTPSAGP